MCEPVSATMLYVSMAATAASAAAQYSSAQKQAKHVEATGRYNARVAENQAQEVRNVGTEKINAARQEAAQLQSRQRAILASRGVQVDEGSALQVQEDTKMMGDINALRIRRNTEGQASALARQSALTTSAAGAQATGLRAQGTSALLAGAGKVAGSWYQLGNQPTTDFGPGQLVT